MGCTAALSLGTHIVIMRNERQQTDHSLAMRMNERPNELIHGRGKQKTA